MSEHDRDRVTVIVPSRNSGPFIAATVQSALAQHVDAVEVLVIDDGSSDDGPTGLPWIDDPRVRILCQPRRGLARTLNVALALARTPWVSVVPPRDVLLPGWRAAQQAALARTPRPGAVFVQPTLLDALGEPLDDAAAADRFAAPGVAPDELRLALLERNFLCFPGALFDRELALHVGGFDPSLRVALDHDLWLRLLRHAPAALLAERLVALTWRRSLGEAAERSDAAAEHGYVIAKALGGAGERRGDWLPPRRRAAHDPSAAEGEACLELARRIARADASGTLGLVAELVARAAAHGVALPDDAEFAPLRARLPALARHAGQASQSGQAPHAGQAADAGQLADAGQAAGAGRAADAGQVAGAGRARPATDRTGAASHADAAPPHPLRVALEVASLDRGGLETVVVRLARALHDAGHRPLVVCTERGGAGAAALHEAGIEVVVLGGADRAAALARLLEERAVELVNAHFSTLGTRIAAALGIPVIVTLHNAYAWLGSGVFDEMRALDPLVGGYVAVSASVADYCAQRFAIDRARIEVLRNPLEPRQLAPAPDRAAARRALGIAADARLLVQVGRIDPIKCQLALVAALQALAGARPELHAWIVGGVGDAAYAHRVRTRVADAGLTARITLAGERGDVPAILAAADVFVMPSLLEGLSLAAIEAMAAGVPAVLTRTGDAAWLLGEDELPVDGVLPGALLDGPELTAHVHSELLNRSAAGDEPPHAAALAAALAAVLDDLPRRGARARVRAAELAATLAPDAWLCRHVELFTAVAAAGAVQRATALGRATRRMIGERDAERRARAPLEQAVDQLSRVLAGNLASQRIAAGLGTTRGELVLARVALGEADEALLRTLGKLRLTQRVRSALRAWTRRPPRDA